MISSDRLTVKAAEALNEALSLARRTGNPLVYDAHLLLALLQQEEGIVVPLLHKIGGNVSDLRSRVEREIARYPKQTGAQPTLSRELHQVMDKADEFAKSLGDEFVSTEHLLVALADVRGTDSFAVLSSAGATRDALVQAQRDLLQRVRGGAPTPCRTRARRNRHGAGHGILRDWVAAERRTPAPVQRMTYGTKYGVMAGVRQC